MARVVAFVPDLLFGSQVLGTLQAGGHDAVLVSEEKDLEGALAAARVLVVDLTAEVDARLAAVAGVLGASGVRSLAFYAHVEADVRAAAQAAGFDQVVPRSRMAREGAALVERLAGD